LPTLKYRRTRGDVIEVYKILNNKYDSKVTFYISKFTVGCVCFAFIWRNSRQYLFSGDE